MRAFIIQTQSIYRPTGNILVNQGTTYNIIAMPVSVLTLNQFIEGSL